MTVVPYIYIDLFRGAWQPPKPEVDYGNQMPVVGKRGFGENSEGFQVLSRCQLAALLTAAPSALSRAERQGSIGFPVILNVGGGGYWP